MPTSGLLGTVRHALSSAGRVLLTRRSPRSRRRSKSADELIVIDFPVNPSSKSEHE